MERINSLNKPLYAIGLFLVGLFVIPSAGYAQHLPTKRDVPITTFPTVPVIANAIHDFGKGTTVANLVGITGSSSYGGNYSFNNTTPTSDPKKNKNGCGSTAGDPIELSSGVKLENTTYFQLPGEMGLKYELYYNSSHAGSDVVGPWSDNLNYYLDVTCNGADNCQYLQLYRPDGSTIKFNGRPDATILANRTHAEYGGGQLATLVQNADNTYTLHDEDATTQLYSQGGELMSLIDESGVGWTITRSAGSGTDTVEKVTHTNGQYFTVMYHTAAGASTTQVTVTDPGQNVYTFVWGTDYVNSVVLPGTPSTTYTYGYGNGGLAEVDINGVPYSYTTYDSSGRANGTHLADGTQATSIVYSTNSTGLSALQTNPLGHAATNQYNSLSQLISISNDSVADCGSTVNSRQYDANGNLSQTIDNNGNVHTYNYADNGQLLNQTLASGTPQARTIDNVWDSNVQLNRLTSTTVEGWSKVAYTYTPQNRIASTSVTNLSSHGTANQTLTTTYQYSLYGNGLVHTLSLTSPSPNNGDTSVFTYDALGNLTSVANGLGQTTTYSNYNGLGQVGHVVGPNSDATDYTYDARGRLQTKVTHPNGSTATWSYTYDGYGLPYTLTTPDNQVTTWNRNAEIMLQTATHNDKDGTSTESFTYDANGDVTAHKVVRGSDVGLSENATYDALGRLYQRSGNNGQTLTYGYDGNGNVTSTTNAAGHVISYQYDPLDRVTQVSESGGASPPLPTTAPSLTVPSSSSTGSYTVSWGTVANATSYRLQEQTNGSSATTVASGVINSWSAGGKANGTYSYQVRACDGAGCGPWSAASSVTVNVPAPPRSAPSLTAPASSATGSYSISWTSVSNTSSYTLQENVNSAGWTTVLNGSATGWSTSSRASGSYGYRVEACNSVGCGVWSAIATTAVNLPPIPGAPSPTSPANNNSGSYTVSWAGVSGATSYNLQQQVNGGSWSTVQSSSATSLALSGEGNGGYGYHAQSCNISGCSGWSATNTTVVTFAPTSAPALTTPGNSATGNYTVSWTAISGATSYVLQQQVNSGSFATVLNSGATSWGASGESNGNYGYQVQACNVGGCGPMSGVSTTNVTQAPPPPASVTAPSYIHGVQYTVSWSAASTATSYTLQKTDQDTGATNVVISTSGTSASMNAPTSSQTLLYAVKACNSSGCSGYTNAGNTTATDPPGPIQ